MPTNLHAQLGALLEQIYDTALDPELWPAVLAAIKQAVGGEVAALLHLDANPTAFTRVNAISGYPEALIQSYEQHFSAIDVRRPAVAAVPVGGSYVDDRNMAFAEIARSEIFNDFYRPLGAGHGIALKLFDESARTGILSVHRALSHGSFRPREIVLFESLAPHLTRTLQMHRQFVRARGLAQGLAAGLDHFPIAVFLVDRDGMIVELNQAASELLRHASCPLRCKAQRLETATPQGTEWLREGIRQSVDTIRGRGSQVSPVLRLPKAGADGAIGVMITPIRRGDRLGLPAEPLALVFAFDPATKPTLNGDVLVRQFGLSTAESDIAIALANGDSSEAIADRRSASRETVRSQIKSILAKTDTHSQAQLVGLVTRSLVALRRRQDR